MTKTRLNGRSEITTGLTSLLPDMHMKTFFFQRLVRVAGRSMTGPDLATTIRIAISQYVSPDRDPLAPEPVKAGEELLEKFDAIIHVMTDDPALRETALAHARLLKPGLTEDLMRLKRHYHHAWLQAARNTADY